MPTTAEHLSKAQSNEQFAATLGLQTSAEIEWAVTATFYAAVHYIEAYLATRGVHSANHAQRNRHVNGLAETRNLWKGYGKLQRLSEKSRYWVLPVTTEDLDQARRLLSEIKRHITELL